MSINVDSHYAIGHSHLENQDYATGGVEPFPYMAISDGCSGSVNSDFGSRMLVMAAKEYLLNHLKGGQIPKPEDLSLYAALKAEAAARVIGLPDTAIDATLIVAFEHEGLVHVYAYGDGAIFYADRDGQFNFMELSYSHNAPYYPSYRLDRPRDVGYRKESEGEVKVVNWNGEVSESMVTTPTVVTLPMADISSLVITSDGVGSFVSSLNASAIDSRDVAMELGAFRNSNGDFVKRKLKRVLKLRAKEGVFNDDDISVAAMVFS